MKTIDKRADAIFGKRYFLKGDQINVMRDTLNYKALVLKLRLIDVWKVIKEFLGYCPKCGEKLFTWSVGVYKCSKCKKTYYS